MPNLAARVFRVELVGKRGNIGEVFGLQFARLRLNAYRMPRLGLVREADEQNIWIEWDSAAAVIDTTDAGTNHDTTHLDLTSTERRSR